METTQERIAVFDKATGKVVAGVMAPTKKYLFAWLEEHPTFEVLKSSKTLFLYLFFSLYSVLD